MRKIFFALALIFTCLATVNPSASAEDIWLSTNDDGSEWYVLDETIEGDDKGKFRWTNAQFKLVEKDGTYKIVKWNFTQTSPKDGKLANWVFTVDYGDDDKYEMNVLTGTDSEKFLLYCMKHLGM